MADKIEEQPAVEVKQPAEIDSSTETMSEIATPPQAQEKPSPEAPAKPLSFSFSIWPPSQRTREAVIERLIETLSTPSVLSKRYGTVPDEEASEIAKVIEEEAFNAAGDSAAPEGGDGIEILQVYSKEVSKRTIDVVKTRSATTPAPESKPSEESEKLDAAPVKCEEIPAAETDA